jgi:hypothetical protein
MRPGRQAWQGKQVSRATPAANTRLHPPFNAWLNRPDQDGSWSAVRSTFVHVHQLHKLVDRAKSGLPLLTCIHHADQRIHSKPNALSVHF